MDRKQFLRRSALLSLAATGMPRIASAFKNDEEESWYQNTEIQLSNGKTVWLQVHFVDNDFTAADNEPFSFVLWIQQKRGPNDTPTGHYSVEKTGKPAKEGEYTVASFKVLSVANEDVMQGVLPKTIRMKLIPGKVLQVELEKGKFTSLANYDPELEDCFLTTACTAARGLPDNCAELTILRGLRDGYMRPSASGSSLIEEYYRIAPSIVRNVNARSNRDAIWNLLYYDLVLPSVEMIQSGKREEAVIHYAAYVGWMKEAFLED